MPFTAPIGACLSTEITNARSAAAEQHDEVAPFHCSAPPVLPTERIAHSLVRQEAAALRDFKPAYDRFGSKAAETNLAMRRPTSALPPKADKRTLASICPLS